MFFIQDHVYELLNTIDACQCFFDIVSIYNIFIFIHKSGKTLESNTASADNLTSCHSSLLFFIHSATMLFILPAPYCRLRSLSSPPPASFCSLCQVFFIIIIKVAPLALCIMYILLYFSVIRVSCALICTDNVGISKHLTLL